MRTAVQSLKRIPKTALLGAAALAIVAVVAVALLAGGSSGDDTPGGGSAQTGHSFTGSGHPNGDHASTRRVSGPISAANVSDLQPAWTRALTAQSQYGSYASSPIVADGVIYSQDLASNVEAIDLRTGEVLWTKSYESPDQGPNGVVVAEGRVFGATATSAFALDQRTGRQIWSVDLVRNTHEGIDMAPGYHDGLVYVSTVPGNNDEFYAGGGVGILWALDAKTGRKVWHFNTAPTERWSPKHTDINTGGGLWYTPSFDDEGAIYFGVGNPGPFPGTERYPWGSSRPGPNLYTNSIVKLDAATGKLRWYYQLTPHDLYDWDLQDPPILTRVRGRDAVVTAGKGGIVIALDRRNGRLLWKRPVGKHNGHDQDPIYAMKGQYEKLRMGQEIYPGLLGGVIAPMSTDGSSVFVPVVNHPVTYDKQTQPQEGSTATGEVVAVDLDSGAIKWKRTFSAAAFGATTVVNDLVFATTFDGVVSALDTRTGKIVWEESLPSATNTGVVVHGDTLIAPAGLAVAEGQAPTMAVYRLGGAASDGP